MPTIDLGSVVGPQGEQGNTGAQGPQGVAGPSLISASTQTTLTGVLAGDGSVVGVRTVDASPTNLSTNLVTSGGVYEMIKTDDAYLKSTTVNPNLLDNWYFVGGGSQQNGGQFPINQRGVTTKTSAQGYFIDRWREYSSYYYTVALQSGGMKLTGQSNAVSMLQQIITERLADINGKTLTLSILTDEDGLRTKTEAVNLTASNANKIVVTGNNDRVLATLTGSTSSLCVVMRIPANEYMTVKAIKLELGSTQTLCHNEGTTENPVWALNEIPNYQQELAKCQRYFWNALPTSGTYLMFNGLATSTSLVSGLIPTPVPMRFATPTISATINWFRGNGGSITTYTAPTTGSIIAGGIHTEIACSGVTASYPYYALFTQFQVSCDL